MPAPLPPLRPDVLEALLGHGLRPREETRPERLRDQVRDLYLYEIRRLRDAARRRAFPMASYASRVVALRRRYPLLSLPLDQWRQPDDEQALR